jgi:hypothetical protein
MCEEASMRFVVLLVVYLLIGAGLGLVADRALGLESGEVPDIFFADITFVGNRPQSAAVMPAVELLLFSGEPAETGSETFLPVLVK